MDVTCTVCRSVLESAKAIADTASHVTISEEGVNATAKTVYTINTHTSIYTHIHPYTPLLALCIG